MYLSAPLFPSTLNSLNLEMIHQKNFLFHLLSIIFCSAWYLLPLAGKIVAAFYSCSPFLLYFCVGQWSSHGKTFLSLALRFGNFGKVPRRPRCQLLQGWALALLLPTRLSSPCGPEAVQTQRWVGLRARSENAARGMNSGLCILQSWLHLFWETPHLCTEADRKATL